MNKFLVIFTLFLALANTASALNFEKTTLNNGMEVIVIEDHRAPVVVHSVWYGAGAADEVAGKTGLAHMLEHMMFKGTDTIPPQEFSKMVARMGGQDNAFTSQDYTAYYQKIGVDKLEDVMKMEADRMVNLKIDDNSFQPELKVVMEERRWRIDSKPKYKFFEKMMAKVLPSSPYGRPVIGWEEDLKVMTLEDTQNWYKTYYAPNNATAIIIGDVTMDTVKPLVNKYYGSIKEKEVVRHNWPIEPMQTKHQYFKSTDKDITVPILYRIYRAPSIFAGVAGEKANFKDSVALYIMAEVLGGGQTGILYEKLVKEQKLADSISVSYDAVSRAEGSLDIFAQPKPDKSLEQLEAEIDSIIEDFIKNYDNEQQLQRTKINILAEDVYKRDDLFKTAYYLGKWIAAGGTPDNFDNWQEVIKTITLSDVKNVAEKYLILNRATTGYLTAK